MPEKLTENDYRTAAGILKCDVAAIKAVAEVESSGDGFLLDGRLKILFEGHQFYKYTKGAFTGSHPSLCFPKWTREFYAKGKTSNIRGAGESARLDAAMQLNRTAALLSASYGKFRIMGFNFAICGFVTVHAFYITLQKNEGEHLKAFCSYIKGNCLDDELRSQEWDKFACRYNGPEYKKNRYGEKLTAAFHNHSLQLA